jgi:outer membrane protein OmpA-like peptidoglycan-associated protein
MNRILLLVFFSFFVLEFNAQSKFDYPIYFAYKVSDLDTTEEKRLGVFLRNFDSFSIDSVSIRGYCDDRGKKKINDTLSKKRAENILDFIQSKIKYNLPYHIQGEGSIGLGGDLKIDSQRTLNRRAELELFYSMTKKKDTAKLKPKPTIKEVPAAPTIEITDFLKSAKKGDNIDLKIYFEGGGSQMTKASIPELTKLLEFLKINQSRKIKLTGHILKAGQEIDGDSYDYKTRDNFLSSNRAKVVYTYLIENGIDKERLSFEGMGSKFPRHQNPELDRRVEIIVVE